MGILDVVAKSCFVEISKTSKIPIQKSWKTYRRKNIYINIYTAINFVERINYEPTSFDIRASMLKSSLVFTEANFIERNCTRNMQIREMTWNQTYKFTSIRPC